MAHEVDGEQARKEEVSMENGEPVRSIDRDRIPDECQLCRPLDYRGDEINEPGGMVTVPRDYGGTKIIHCCERCANELWIHPDFSPYDTNE